MQNYRRKQDADTLHLKNKLPPTKKKGYCDEDLPSNTHLEHFFGSHRKAKQRGTRSQESLAFQLASCDHGSEKRQLSAKLPTHNEKAGTQKRSVGPLNAGSFRELVKQTGPINRLWAGPVLDDSPLLKPRWTTRNDFDQRSSFYGKTIKG